MRRKRHKLRRPIEVWYARLVEAGRERRGMRQQAERVAQAAGELVLLLVEVKDTIAVSRWLGGELGPIAGHTRAALPVLARALLAPPWLSTGRPG